MRKPRKRVLWVRHDLWACDDPNHHHKSYDVAQKCLNGKPTRLRREIELEQWAEKIRRAESVLQTETYEQAAAKHGVSATAMRAAFCRVMQYGDYLAEKDGCPWINVRDKDKEDVRLRYMLVAVDRIARVRRKFKLGETHEPAT